MGKDKAASVMECSFAFLQQSLEEHTHLSAALCLSSSLLEMVIELQSELCVGHILGDNLLS